MSKFKLLEVTYEINRYRPSFKIINSEIAIEDNEREDGSIAYLHDIDEDIAELIVRALERQTPKKIFRHPWVGIDGVPYDLCPNCETNLCTTGIFPNKKEKFCAKCGQRLDWS